MNINIWSEAFWLPNNVTWKEFTQLENNGVYIPKVRDLLYVYPLAGMLYLARLFFEYTIAQPLGRAIGIRECQSTNQRISSNQSSDKIQQQHRSTRVSPLAKFSESTWRFTFYLGIFLYGLIILKNVSTLFSSLFTRSFPLSRKSG